jgi:acyl carrier protein
MNEKVLQCVYAAVDEANDNREDLPPLAKSRDTLIHDANSGLDSLGLVNFVVAVEEEVERSLGVTIALSDDRALSTEPSPLRSVGSLTEYIELLLEEEK